LRKRDIICVASHAAVRWLLVGQAAEPVAGQLACGAGGAFGGPSRARVRGGGWR
jgi:hypothetical protein